MIPVDMLALVTENGASDTVHYNMVKDLNPSPQCSSPHPNELPTFAF